MMLLKIIILVLVIIISLIFKYYILKCNIFKSNILEGVESNGVSGTNMNTSTDDTDTDNNYVIGASSDPTINIITKIEGDIEKLNIEIAKLELEIANGESLSAEKKILLQNKMDTLKQHRETLQKDKEFYEPMFANNSELIQAQIKALIDAQKTKTYDNNILESGLTFETAVINLDTDNTVMNTYEDDTHLYYYFTKPGAIALTCTNVGYYAEADIILLGGGGAGGGNHGGGGGAGVIVWSNFTFKQGNTYIIGVAYGGTAMNTVYTNSNVPPSGGGSLIWDISNNNSIFAFGGFYGGGGISGPAYNIDGRVVYGGSGGGGMAYNYPSETNLDTRRGKASQLGSYNYPSETNLDTRRGKASQGYAGGSGVVLEYSTNAGNGGGGGGAAEEGETASQTKAGNGGSGISAPGWLDKLTQFMNEDWKRATNGGKIIAGGGGGGAWSEYLCIPGIGGNGGGGNGGGCVYSNAIAGLPNGYNSNGLTKNEGKEGCPMPKSDYQHAFHHGDIIGTVGYPGAPNTGSGGGGGSSTGFMGGNGGSGLVVFRVLKYKTTIEPVK